MSDDDRISVGDDSEDALRVAKSIHFLHFKLNLFAVRAVLSRHTTKARTALPNQSRRVRRQGEGRRQHGRRRCHSSRRRRRRRSLKEDKEQNKKGKQKERLLWVTSDCSQPLLSFVPPASSSSTTTTTTTIQLQLQLQLLNYLSSPRTEPNPELRVLEIEELEGGEVSLNLGWICESAHTS